MPLSVLSFFLEIMKKKIFSLFLVLYLVVSNATYVYAEAATATLAVTGSIATGGISASALVPYALPIVGGVLLGAGINVYLTNASENAGMTKSEFIKSKINSYCDAARTTAGDFAKKILDGARIARDGTIQLTDQACSQINQFVNWLKANNEVYENTGTGNGQTITFNGLTLPYGTKSPTCIDTSNNQQCNLYTTVPCAFIQDGLSGYQCRVFAFCRDENCLFNFIPVSESNPSPQSTSNSTINGYSMYTSSGTYWTYAASTDVIPAFPAGIDNIRQFLMSLDGTMNPDQTMANPENDTFTGTQDALQGLGNILNPAPDKTTVLNPGLTGSLDIPGVQNPTIDVGDYLDALTRVLDRAGTLDIPVTDPATGTIEQTRVTPTTYEPTIDKVDNPDLPDPTITNPAINPDNDGDPVQMATPLAIQFKGVFPFCIPFDVKDMISLLNATPEAPNYHVRWYIPFADTYLDFNVDLSGWNSTAAICRQMELLLFCIGLAFVTRSMFLRG